MDDTKYTHVVQSSSVHEGKILKFICWEMKYSVLFSCSSDSLSYSFVEDFYLNLFELTVLLQLFNFSVPGSCRELKNAATTCSFRFLRSAVTNHLRKHPHISSLFSIVTSRHLSLLYKCKIIFSTQSLENRPWNLTITLKQRFPNCGPRTTGGPRVLPLWSS
jgi:hypothetical protein